MMLPWRSGCSRFRNGVAGFCLASLKVSQREATGDPIPGMTADALKDMAAIAQVDPDETDSDEAERQLEDVIEYIRFAAINIVTEAQALQEASMTGSTP